MSHDSAHATERKAWYVYDMANSVFSSVAIALFLPIFVVNIVERAIYSDLDLSGCDSLGFECTDDLCVTNGSTCTSCVPGFGTQMWNGTAFEPLEERSVSFLGLNIKAISFATSSISMSVILQVFVFISLASFADYGAYRKQLMMITCYLGCLACMLFGTITDFSQWAMAGWLLIISNIMFGTSIVFYNAYLPHLVDSHPEVLAAKEGNNSGADILKIRDRIENTMSTNGFAMGYGATFFMLIVCFALQFTVDNSETSVYLADRLCLILVGLWWGGLATYTFCYLKEHPGPEFPEASWCSKLGFGWKNTFDSLRQAKELKNTGLFLLLFFIYSDGFGTIGSIGVLFASTELCMGSLELVLVLVEIQVIALLGNIFFLKVQHYFDWSSKTMLIIILAVVSFLPFWGLLGLVSDTIGLRNKWEIYVFAAFYGLCVGAQQSYSRTLFCDLTPAGKESQFFGLYEITDKGSSWIGPLVLSACFAATGEMRWTFFYLFFTMIFPIPVIHYFVDHEGGMKAAGRIHEEDDSEGPRSPNRPRLGSISLNRSMSKRHVGYTVADDVEEGIAEEAVELTAKKT